MGKGGEPATKVYLLNWNLTLDPLVHKPNQLGPCLIDFNGKGPGYGEQDKRVKLEANFMMCSIMISVRGKQSRVGST